jgi:tetratricopeptide (TPR) repeat protein
MSTQTSDTGTGTCFVVMGFGKKTDFETGRTLDLDKSYRNMIKPAVEAAGLKCIRADEIVHSGLIDVPMYQQLLNADVVVADLSTSNKNAFYELGVRHALRPYTTVVIAEDGIKTFPFDVNHVLVRQYHHLGEDIGFDEAMRFREVLTKSIKEITEKNPRDKDSPVYTYLNELIPPAVAAAAQAAAAKISDSTRTEVTDSSTHSKLMQQVDEAQKKGDFVAAKNFLSFIRGMMRQEAPSRPEDPYIIQRLAFVTYKSEYPSEKEALIEAKDLLSILNPETSNDTETLGLWGSIHKHLWDVSKDAGDLDKAINSYERGFFIRNDSYNGINVAYLFNIRAAHASEPAEAIADFVQAQRIRREVLAICERWLADNPAPAAEASVETVNEYHKTRYWVLATMAEGYLGLGYEAESQRRLTEAFSLTPEKWMRDSTEDQMGKLKPLIADSPLKYISQSRVKSES